MPRRRLLATPLAAVIVIWRRADQGRGGLITDLSELTHPCNEDR